MVRVKSVQEWSERYAESALISAIRLRRYWLSQGLPENKAIERAVNQAVGMMATSGVPIDKLIALFTEMEGASRTFIGILKQSQKEIEKTQKGEGHHR